MRSPKKVTAPYVRSCKSSGHKLAAVTAYDATFARLLDEGGADVLLVGDSLGMVVQGLPNTLPVTIEEMVYHTRAVARAAMRAQVVADLPFLSYQVSPEAALLAAGKLVQQGSAEAVKLEGGVRSAEAVDRIVSAGIPVMGHIGLTPQSFHEMGGFKVQGRHEETKELLLKDARALEDAGVYSLVVEGVPSDVGRAVTQAVSVPTIGIGAGPDCDGQVLVCYDMLGLIREFRPKFVKRYAQLGEGVVSAMAEFAHEVQTGAFPDAAHSFAANDPPKRESEPTGSEAVVQARPPSYGAAREE